MQNNGSKICVSLREHHDVTFAKNDTAAYTPCFKDSIESQRNYDNM